MKEFDDTIIRSTAKAFEDDRDLVYCIFTKSHHVEKIVNFLNTTDIKYFITSDKQEIKNFAFPFDIGISYCCPYILQLDERPFYNYHPAPLPKYKGVTIYADAIKNGERIWGVTVHRMTSAVDEGEIIEAIKFPIYAPLSTNELGTAAHYYLFRLFRATIQGLNI